MRVLLILLGLAALAEAAPVAPKAKDASSLFALPPQGCTAMACDATPGEKIISRREVNSIFEPARRECCSRQGGVCGCAGGRVVCCDGSLNAICGCD